MIRVQVLMQAEDREEFKRLAERSGMSLSAWLRRAGLEEAGRQKEQVQLNSQEALREFFAACDATEIGTESDWVEHKRVIERSKVGGESGT